MHDRPDHLRQGAARPGDSSLHPTAPTLRCGLIAAVLACVFASASCGGETEYKLASASRPDSKEPRSVADGEHEPERGSEDELRRRMAVRVVNRDTGDCSQITCGPNQVCVNVSPADGGACDSNDDGIPEPDANCCYSREEELNEFQIAQEFMMSCMAHLADNPPPADGICSFFKPNAYAPVCAANRLLDAAGLRSEPLTYEAAATPAHTPAVPNGTLREIYPQSAASRVSLALAAFRVAVHGLRVVNAAIRGALNAAGAIPACGEETARSLSSDLVSAYHVAQEAIDVAVENTLAVADAHMSSTPATRERNARAFLGVVLSRSAAAHMLVGGEPGLPTTTAEMTEAFNWGGSMQFAMCTQPPLTPQAELALRTLREAAVSPADVIGTLDTNVLVNGTALPSGSARERLRELWDADELVAGDLPDFLGLRLEDFQEARDYLAQEISIFRRSLTAELPARELAGGGFTTFPRYAGTATPPPQRDPMYWVTVAQHQNYGLVNSSDQPYAATPSLSDALKARYSNSRYYSDLYIEHPINGLQNSTPDDQYPLAVAQYGLAGFIDTAVEVATKLIPVIEEGLDFAGTPNAGVSDEMKAGLLDPLLLFLQEGRARRPGRLVVRVLEDEGTVLAECFEPSDGLLLVEGEDGLACAVDGSVDGASCSLASAQPFSEAGTGPFASGCSTAAVAAGLQPERHYYVVEPVQPGSTGPGSYRSLASFITPKVIDAVNLYDRYVPMVPDLAERAARVLAPSRKWCARPLVSCMGESFDARLPLEDELTDDGDPVESSWRYYLQLARQAADEADLLGERVIDLSLEQLLREEQKQIRQIQRAEPAVAELQDICGIDVDPTVLLRALSSDGSKDFNALRGQTCTTSANCAMGESCLAGRCTRACLTDSECGDAWSSCVNGICAVDPLLFVQLGLLAHGGLSGDLTEFARLTECLSEGTLVPYVTTGDRPLCIWRNDVAPNYVCEGATASNPCPRLANSDGTCVGVIAPPGHTVELVDKTLDFFKLSQQGPGRATTDLCNDIRRLRLNPGNRALLNKIRDTNFFDPDQLEVIGRRLQWYGIAGGYSSVMYGSRTVAYTADNSGNKWPCSGGLADPPFALPVCGTEGTGLFCAEADCGDETARAQINRRLRDAVIAARDMTIADGAMAMAGVHLPVLALNDGTQYSFQNQQYTRDSNWYDTTVNGVPFRHIWARVLGGQSYNLFVLAYECQHANGAVCQTTPLWRINNTSYWEPYGFDDRTWTIAFGPVGQLQRGATIDADGNPNFDGLKKDYDPGHWFSNLTTNWRYLGEPAVRDARTQHRDFLYDQLAGRDRPFVAYGLTGKVPSLDYFEPLVIDLQQYLSRHGGVPDGSGVSVRGLPPSMSWYRRDAQTMLDGMELLCEVAVGGEGECGEPPEITGPHDLRFAAKFLECVADNIRYKAAYGILFDFPIRAFDALREDSAVGSFPRVGGQMGEAISLLRSSLVALSSFSTALADNIEQLAHDLRTLERSLEIADLEEELRQIEFSSTVASQMAQCASSMFSAGGLTGLFASAASCSNALGQIHFSRRIKALEGEIAEIGTEQSIDDFQSQFEDRIKEFDDVAIGLTEAQEQLDAQLAALETLRRRGHRALAKALFMDSDVMEAEAAYDVGSFLRLNTARVRYDAARKSAQRMAFFARRAIEQRLGVDLTTLTEQLPLVAAPSSWADQVCETSGYDFSKAFDLGHYADAYIGDYVTKLENLVESYRQTHNFHEGTDTAVISLRDDVKNSRAFCSVPVNNLLFHAGQLDVPAQTDDAGQITSPGWAPMGCRLDPATDQPLPNCVSALALPYDPDPMTGEDRSDPIPGPRPEMSDAAGYVVRFGAEAGSCTATDCGFQQSSALGQILTLPAGRYRLSWYGRDDGNDPAASVAIRYEGDSSWTLFNPTVEPTSGLWSRYYDEFVVDEEQEVVVAVVPDMISDPSEPETQEVYIGALMLEDMTRSEAIAPNYFANTSVVLEQNLPLCEDTTGDVFRRQFWTRGCMQICADGFASVCSDVNAETHCYRELKFSIDPRSIEAGNALTVSGFARGNFNYRIESIGFNMVGAGTRTCEGAATPSSCYAGGFIPFSLEHLGPYRVRNYQGEDFRVELFPGIIEHARALAAERYLTNPMSSADRALIEPYLRSELRGRPLDGLFVLRVWEEEGVDFSRIEDVQLVLNYRYWTRNQ